MTDYDLGIIGAGPGGYVAAIRAGQLGLRTAVVEAGELGGVCLNWGCIPSKALLRNAEVIHLFNRAEEFGVSFENLSYDYGVAQQRSRQVVGKLTKGVAALLRKNGVEHIKGKARLRDANTIEVAPSGQSITARNVIIATGARTASIPGLEIDGDRIITSREALELRELPERMVIIGGGATGVEFAYLFNAYGTQTTILEMLPRLVPAEDEEISRLLERSFSRQGINVHTGSRVTNVTVSEDGVKLELNDDGENTILETDRVLVAAGVLPNTEELGLDSFGVTLNRGFIEVDGSMATNVAGLYAIGDVTGIMLLAHVASAQGVLAVERIAGMDVPELNYAVMPRATYCHPQVTSYGITEKQAMELGRGIKVGKFPFAASGKALAIAEDEGLTKIIVDEESGEILGAHLIGAEVTEMLGELSLAQSMEITSWEIGQLVHSHPTLSETLKEAALAVDGQAIHI